MTLCNNNKNHEHQHEASKLILGNLKKEVKLNYNDDSGDDNFQNFPVMKKQKKKRPRLKQIISLSLLHITIAIVTVNSVTNKIARLCNEYVACCRGHQG